MNRRELLRLFSTTALFSAAPSIFTTAFAASRSTATMLVGFPPGGSTDVVARAVAGHAHGPGGSVAIVENVGGAAGRIAVSKLIGSEPDGSTVLVAPTSTMTLFPHIFHPLNYDPETDITPVGPICSFAFTLVVSPEVVPDSVQTLDDLKVWLAQNPDYAAYATGGAGTPMHFIGVMVGDAFDQDLTHVAYKGAAPMIQDLLGGQIALGVTVLGDSLPHLQSGKLRALAITSPERSPHIPQVPTVSELNYPSLTTVEEFGVYLPANAPKVAQELWIENIKRAQQTPKMQEMLNTSAYQLAHATPDEFAARLQQERERWADVVKLSGFRIET